MTKLILTSALVLVGSFPLLAADTDYCTNFALLTTNQYWTSYKLGCAPDKAEWNGNYSDQYNWCLDTHQWVIENANNVRTRMLEECKQGNSPPPESTSENKQKNNIRLIEAVSKDDLNLAKKLIKQGADIHYITNKQEIIKKFGMGLITEETTIGKAETFSESLLSYAINQGSAEVGLWILDILKKEIPSDVKEIHRTNLLGNALVNASKEKSVTKVLKYLNKGAYIDFEYDINTGTALYFAVSNKDIAMVKLLLSKNANPNYKTPEGDSLLVIAIDEPDILELLLNKGANPNAKVENFAKYPLNQAILKKQASSVKLLLSHKANTQISDSKTPPAIIQAVKQQDIASLDMLIQAKANLNIIYNKSATGQCNNEKNQTALDIAKRLKIANIIKLLESYHAKTAKDICETR